MVIQSEEISRENAMLIISLKGRADEIQLPPSESEEFRLPSIIDHIPKS